MFEGCLLRFIQVYGYARIWKPRANVLPGGTGRTRDSLNYTQGGSGRHWTEFPSRNTSPIHEEFDILLPGDFRRADPQGT